jgi:hypothetical protein
MVAVEKLVSYSLILIGIMFLLCGIGTIYVMIQVSGLMEAVGSLAGTTGGQMPSFTTYIVAGWIFAILGTITGFITLIAGIAILVQK